MREVVFGKGCRRLLYQWFYESPTVQKLQCRQCDHWRICVYNGAHIEALKKTSPSGGLGAV